MRCGRPLLLRTLVALSLLNALVLSRVVVRQTGDDAASTVRGTPSSTVKDITRITSGADSTPTPTGDGNGRNSKSEASKSDGGSPSRTSVSVPSTSGGSLADVNTTAGSLGEVYSGGLPIHPRLSPGLVVAGVLLILAGLPYCLIGIKMKMLHIFMSTCLLASLGVTVLIIYVMNPPVKDAIQGAYITAVVITGVVAGGLAVIFPEVTEALGCLLGGFCISMWFLVLKPGGLITSTYGKLILMASMSLFTFSLSFHRITRPYGLIFSLSFAGATATVLGIDCFSRAGLKEFWLYIWALNDNIFPLETNTYPHTRGIRVELAVVILVTALGIMSQVKLWIIVKERRNLKETEQRRENADLEAIDEDTGKRVEEEHRTERAVWEKQYGNKDNIEVKAVERRESSSVSRNDSGLGDEATSGKRSEEQDFVETEKMKDERLEHIQMTNITSPSTRSKSENNSTEGLTEDGGSRTPKSGTLTPESASRRVSTQSSSHYLDPAAGENSRAIPTPQPNFPIPTEDDNEEGSSLATWAASSRAAPLSVAPDVSEKDDEDDEDDEDESSSMAVTYDLLNPDDRRISQLPSPSMETDFGDGESGDAESSTKQPSDNTTQGESGDAENSTKQPSDNTTPPHTSPPSLAESKPPVVSEYAKSDAPSITASLNSLQIRCSKVVKNYRTNEWAKHLTNAEKPSLEVLEQSIPEDSDVKEEVPAPVHVELLGRASEVPSRASSRTLSKVSFSESPQASPPNQGIVLGEVARNSSVTTLPGMQQPASSIERTIPTNARTMPVPLPQNTLIGKRESMVRSRPSFNALAQYDNDPSAVFSFQPSDFQRSASAMDFRRSSSAMDFRRSSSAMSFNPIPLAQHQVSHDSHHHGRVFRQPSTSILPPIPAGESIQCPKILDDDMPLSERRMELRQQSSTSTINTMPPLPPAHRHRRAISNQVESKRDALLKSWRESLKSDQMTNSNNLEMHPIQERRIVENQVIGRRMSLDQANNNNNNNSGRPRMGFGLDLHKGELTDAERRRNQDMLMLHKEAMRRMQASANKHVQYPR